MPMTILTVDTNKEVTQGQILTIQSGSWFFTSVLAPTFNFQSTKWDKPMVFSEDTLPTRENSPFLTLSRAEKDEEFCRMRHSGMSSRHEPGF